MGYESTLFCQKMKERPPQETSIGVFIWKGIHTKWDCENSSTDPSLSINLDYKEIEPSHIERINSILESRDTYLGPAMKCAKNELKEYAVEPAAMRLSGIGLSDELYPDGFVLVYDYPNEIWQDGQLSVVFKKGKPKYFHSGD